MQSMEEIYQQYAQTVYRYLFSLVRDPDLAEELTQETFYQAIRSIDRYDASCKITTWLCAIAKNALRTHRRDEAGIKHFCMHALRHTYATRAIERGVQPKVLQQLLGHASIQTTMDRYVHISDDSLLKAVHQFESGCA